MGGGIPTVESRGIPVTNSLANVGDDIMRLDSLPLDINSLDLI